MKLLLGILLTSWPILFLLGVAISRVAGLSLIEVLAVLGLVVACIASIIVGSILLANEDI